MIELRAVIVYIQVFRADDCIRIPIAPTRNQKVKETPVETIFSRKIVNVHRA